MYRSRWFQEFLLTCLVLALGLSLQTLSDASVAAQSGGPSLGEWAFYGDFVAASGDPCHLNLPVDGFALGIVSSSCSGGERGGTAISTLDIPTVSDRQLLIIRIVCADVAGCATSLTSSREAQATLSIDGQTLWSAHCDAVGLCNPLALEEMPQVAFVPPTAGRYRLALSVTEGAVWRVLRLELDWEAMPDDVHGIAYSPYRDCQNPHFGPFPDVGQIHEDMVTLRNMGNAIRTYASAGISGEIPSIARQYGLRVSAGAWLGRDRVSNEEEIEGLIEISRHVELDSVIVGNEVLLRGDLSEAELLHYIERVKAAVHVPVTTADVAFIFEQHPNLVNAIDYVLVHIYGYWEQQPIQNAARYVVDRYHDIQQLADGKRVVIGETGWPSFGPANGSSVPSPENQRRFMQEFLTLAEQENVEYYYFSAFNELWKTEGGVGAFWGVLDSERRNLYDFQSVLIPMSTTIQAGTITLGASPTSTPPANASWQGRVFPIYTDYAVFSETNDAESNHFGPSGWMGDIHTINVDSCARSEESWQNRFVSLRYSPSPQDLGGWAGVYWQNPDNNWAVVPNAGYDLTGYAQLRFEARADFEGAEVQFFVGGTDDGPYPSSIPDPIHAQEADNDGYVTLSTEWNEYHIDLREADLRYVIDGFGWVADRIHTPDGVTVYVDNIVYDTTPPPDIPVIDVIPVPQLVILDGSRLARGYSLGVDTSQQERTWVVDEEGAFRLDYPSGQDWGVVFITVGAIVPPGQRSSIDLSDYDALAVDLRGDVGGEVVTIGIKDDTDPDDGTEAKIPTALTTEWRTIVLPFSQFTSADPARIYIPIEIVFESGAPSQTVYMRNVRYLRSALDD